MIKITCVCTVKGNTYIYTSFVHHLATEIPFILLTDALSLLVFHIVKRLTYAIKFTLVALDELCREHNSTYVSSFEDWVTMMEIALLYLYYVMVTV